MNRRNIFERAFELARDGEHRSVEDIRRKLKQEKFDSVDGHLAGSTIVRQLKAAMSATQMTVALVAAEPATRA